MLLVPLLHFFVCASVVSHMAFDVSLFVPHISLLWCLGRVVLRDCGSSWIFSHILSGPCQFPEAAAYSNTKVRNKRSQYQGQSIKHSSKTTQTRQNMKGAPQRAVKR